MKNVIRAGLLAVVLAGMWAASAAAEVAVKLDLVAEGLVHPVAMRQAPDGSGRIFIVDQGGVIRIVGADGKLMADPFLDLRGKLIKQHPQFDERGLLSMEFHPKFKENGKFYVYYDVALPEDSALPVLFWWSHLAILSEFKANGNKADMASEREVLRFEWPQFNHNGGDMHFGPDGYLYVSQGDGGYADDWGIGHDKVHGNGQMLNTHFGKILRIDVNVAKGYGIPKDNPFVGKKVKTIDESGAAKEDDAFGEIWSYGHRNPWRFSFDMGGTHQLFVDDVQQNSYEEVDIVVKGGNYGWRLKEGTHCFDYTKPNGHPEKCNVKGTIDPIIEYNNCNKFPKDCKGLSGTGGYVYRGKNKAWDGKYIWGDWSKQFGTADGHLFMATKGANGKWTMDDVKVTNMAFSSYVLAFGQDDAGEVYTLVADSTGPAGAQGKVFKISAP